jgi:hypothetical protein
VARLLEINVEFQSFFRKQPFFETDPVCLLARQLCFQNLGSHMTWDDIDRLVVNGGLQPQDGPMPIPVNIGPKKDPNDAIPQTFPDFLISGNRPRPIWMAWLPQARAAIEGLKAIGELDA